MNYHPFQQCHSDVLIFMVLNLMHVKYLFVCNNWKISTFVHERRSIDNIARIHGKTNWLHKGASECMWCSVSCDTCDGVVSATNLASKNLVGHSPSEIGEFFELNHSMLNDNNLKGSLPVKTVKLNSLHALKFSYDVFIGSSCSEIKYLSKSRYLYLSSNRFSSTLPSKIFF